MTNMLLQGVTLLLPISAAASPLCSNDVLHTSSQVLGQPMARRDVPTVHLRLTCMPLVRVQGNG